MLDSIIIWFHYVLNMAFRTMLDRPANQEGRAVVRRPSIWRSNTYTDEDHFGWSSIKDFFPERDDPSPEEIFESFGALSKRERGGTA